MAVTWCRFPSRFWIAGLLFFLLVHLEIWFGGRHQLHGLVVGCLKQSGWYSQRQTPQIAASLLFGTLIFTLGCALPVWIRHSRGRLGAILSIGLLTLTFGLELVSLHAVDAVLYQKFGSVLLIGWLWAAACVPLWWTLIRHAPTTDPPARQRNQK